MTPLCPISLANRPGAEAFWGIWRTMGEREGSGRERSGGADRSRTHKGPPCGWKVEGELENRRKIFPIIGKIGPFFQPLEKTFQSLGKPPGIFQPLETFFPIIGKLSRRPPRAKYLARSRGGAEGKPFPRFPLRPPSSPRLRASARENPPPALCASASPRLCVSPSVRRGA